MLCPLLVELFKVSVTLRYVPKAWRKVRVVFIPKSGNRDKTTPKAFRPISLSSVMLKTMEKILDEFIKSRVLFQMGVCNIWCFSRKSAVNFLVLNSIPI